MYCPPAIAYVLHLQAYNPTSSFPILLPELAQNELLLVLLDEEYPPGVCATTYPATALMFA